VASVRIEYLRWRDLRDRERHQTPRR
jgi:hypothetical protein